MPTGNFDEPIVASTAEAAPPKSFRWPADYYSTSAAEVRTVIPRGLKIGCGVASIAFLVLLFIAGAVLSGPMLGQLMDTMLATSTAEIRGMYTPDVTAAHKERFDNELKPLREGLRTGTVQVTSLQPFLETMKSVIADKKVTPEELDRLSMSARALREPAKKKAR